MEISVSNWLISILPIMLLIVLLTIYRYSVIRAGIITLIVTLLTTYFYFKGGPMLIIIETLKGVWNAMTIIAIIFPALLIYEIVKEGDCMDPINQGLEKLSPNELFKIIAIGWVFAGFLQGITGFGVPVAICVPLLISMGVMPQWAVIISLIGQAWGNTFGTLAVAWQIIVEIAKITGSELLATAAWTAILLWSLNLFSGLAVCWFYGKRKAVYKGLPIVLIISLIQGGGELLMVQYNQTVAAFIPSTIALLAIVLLSKLPMYKKEWQIEKSRIMSRDAVIDGIAKDMDNARKFVAFLPYIILVIVTVLLQVIRPINAFLSQWSFGISFPATKTGYGIVNSPVGRYSPIMPLADSSTVLFITCICSYIILRKNMLLGAGSYKRLLISTLRKTVPSAISIIILIIISKLMSGSGQTLLIAKGITNALGINYTLMAVTLGVIGSFITGSNMSSNILFTDIQINASNALGVSKFIFLGAQTTGGAIGSVIAPSKIIMGTSSANISGKEGEVLRKILPFALISAVIIGILCWVVL